MPRLAPLTLVLSLVLTSLACAGSESGSAAPDAPTMTATWQQGPDAPFPGSLAGEVVVPASREGTVTITLDNARFTTLPSACRQSTIVRARSLLVDGNARLRCALAQSDAVRIIRFGAVAVGARGDELGGTVRFTTGSTAQVALPTIRVAEAPAALTPRLRLVSSPDFLNADVGDLRRGPGFWNRRRSTNGINNDYRRAIDKVLRDWETMGPDGVFVAGDLVDGRWGRDDKGTGNFGKVRTLRQQQRALDRAAATYYPQWIQRFRKHDLEVFPAPGDHEYGDNPWPAAKRALVPRFRERFADFFTRTSDGKAKYPDHPKGPHASTAYAGRPLPDVQVITIDPFDITRERARIGLDPAQRTWLRNVLRQARKDGVQWIIVQGHVPILGPVRTRGSSRLHLMGGADSAIWKLFEKYDVDLYLAGEAHDVTVLEEGGVTQIVHGGLFQFGLTNALLLDVYDDFVYLTLRDYDVRHRDAADGTRLWETVREGMPRHIKVRNEPFGLGTGVLRDSGGIRDASGLLRPGL
ncbi:MAG TPA: metallophosphoesterase [Nocardioides sp.]|nr:metallophosphoesterase [Nocardioides sp.]